MRLFLRLEMLAALLALLCLAAGCGDDDDDSAPDDDATDDDDASPDDDTGDDDDITDDDTVDDDTGDDDTDEEGPYYQDFLRYWRTMDEGYAYFIEKQIDWDAVFETNDQSAFNEDDPADFALLIARITAALNDVHTRSGLTGVPLERMPFKTATGVCLQRMDESVHLSRLTPAAEAAGMILGDQVLQLDDEPVDDVLDRAVSWQGCSSDQCCDYYRLSHVDQYASGQDEVVYSLMRGAQPLEVSLSRGGGTDGVCKHQTLVDFLADAEGGVLKYKPIGDDLGYLQLSTLSDGYQEQIEQDLDQALSDFAGVSGLIFDARYNGGGSDLVAMAVLKRFLSQIVIPVSVRYKNGPAHDQFSPWIPEPVLGGSSPTGLPVVFLVNGGCVSAADFFVAAASYVPTFTLLGTASCGGTGAPKSDTLPYSGITYYYSQMQRRYRETGEQIEGVGVAPDLVVDLDPEDLALGIDTQIEAAVDLLRDSAGIPY